MPATIVSEAHIPHWQLIDPTVRESVLQILVEEHVRTCASSSDINTSGMHHLVPRRVERMQSRQAAFEAAVYYLRATGQLVACDAEKSPRADEWHGCTTLMQEQVYETLLRAEDRLGILVQERLSAGLPLTAAYAEDVENAVGVALLVLGYVPRLPVEPEPVALNVAPTWAFKRVASSESPKKDKKSKDKKGKKSKGKKDC